MNEIYHIYTDNPIIVLSLLILIFVYFFKPKKINSWYGYRTSRSVQNQKQWDLAQNYSVKLFLQFLTVTLFIQFIFYKIVENDGYSSLLTTAVFVLISIIVIYKTEKKLKITSHINK